MKKAFILFSTLVLLAALLEVGLGCRDNIVFDDVYITNTDYVASETFTSNIDTSTKSRLRVEGFNGSIIITGRSNSRSVMVCGEKKVGSVNIEDAKLHLADLKVLISDLNDEILIKTSQPQISQGRSYIVNYVILVPDYFEISVNNTNGNIHLDSVNNSVNINDVNGSIILNNMFGNTNISLVNGKIKCKQILPLDGSINLNIVNGSIELFIPQNTSSEFIAGVVNGDINLSNLVIRYKVNLTNLMKGTIGEGKGMINLETNLGSIYVVGY